jgi:hypothetical protein
MTHGPWLMEQAERISLKFEAGIRFQKFDVTGCYWAGSGKGVGQMEMTRTCCSPVSPWQSVDLNRVVLILFFLLLFTCSGFNFRGSEMP